jgi:cellulase
MHKFAIISTLFAALSTVQGHAHITSWSIGGQSVQGFEFWQHKNTQKLNSSWYSENGDNGFVPAGSVNAPDIICHKAAKPGSTHTRATAGTIHHRGAENVPG